MDSVDEKVKVLRDLARGKELDADDYDIPETMWSDFEGTGFAEQTEEGTWVAGEALGLHVKLVKKA